MTPIRYGFWAGFWVTLGALCAWELFSVAQSIGAAIADRL